MKKFLVIALVLVALTFVGCKTSPVADEKCLPGNDSGQDCPVDITSG